MAHPGHRPDRGWAGVSGLRLDQGLEQIRVGCLAHLLQ